MAEPRLAAHGLVYTAGRVVQVVAYVAVMPLVTRQMGLEAYGRIAVALVVFQAIAAIAPLGLTSVVAWSIYDDGPAGIHRAQRLLVATIGVTAALVAAAQVTGPWWSQVFADLSFAGPLSLAVWMVLPFCVQAAALAVFQAQHRPGAFVASTLVSTVGGQGCGLILLSTHGTPTAYVAGVLLGSVVGALLALILLPLRTLRPAGLEAVIAGIRHGGPAVAHLLAFMVLALSDRILIERIIGLDGAARYQVAYVVGSVGTVLLYGLNNAWAPIVYADPDRERWTTLARSSVPMAWVVSLVVAAVTMAAPVGLRILAPASYDLGGLSDVVALIAVAALFDFAYLTAVHVLFATKRTGPLLVIMPIAAIVNVALNVLLLATWGIIAAALSTLVGFGVAAGLALRASRRVAKVPWDVGALARPLSAAVICGLVALVLPTDGPALLLRVVVAVVAGAILIVGAGRALRRPTEGGPDHLPRPEPSFLAPVGLGPRGEA